VPKVFVKPPVFDKVVEARGYLSGIDEHFGTMRQKTNQKRATKGSCGDEAGLGRVFGENQPTKT